MKTPSERDELLAEVLAENEQLRESTLHAGLAALRHRRRRRSITRMTIVAILPLAAVAWLLSRPLEPVKQAQPRREMARETSIMVEGTHIRVVNDEELLA